jgi:hypothetical protein
MTGLDVALDHHPHNQKQLEFVRQCMQSLVYNSIGGLLKLSHCEGELKVDVCG